MLIALFSSAFRPLTTARIAIAAFQTLQERRQTREPVVRGSVTDFRTHTLEAYVEPTAEDMEAVEVELDEQGVPISRSTAYRDKRWGGLTEKEKNAAGFLGYTSTIWCGLGFGTARKLPPPADWCSTACWRVDHAGIRTKFLRSVATRSGRPTPRRSGFRDERQCF